MAVLRKAARDPHADGLILSYAGGVGYPLSVRELIEAAFEYVLAYYAAYLPFGGYWVRVARDWILDNLPQLAIPAGLPNRK